ncbi:hypothetical protein CRENBAI_003377 [Crenichthys baileyi]|uniref:Uncharacterized protein n=1 Tax=Crenichthys baileyi TaxID=28760 RepID=A0AAV9RVG0_9TELE
MRLSDGGMAAKGSEGSIKWQLCYDISARTWWMVLVLIINGPKTWNHVSPSSVCIKIFSDPEMYQNRSILLWVLAPRHSAFPLKVVIGVWLQP